FGLFPTLIAAFLYFDVSFMVWVLLGPLAPFLSEMLKLTPYQKGLLTAIPLLGGALFRPVLGFLGERFGERRTGLFGLAFTLLPLILGWRFAHTAAQFYFLGLLLGIGGASFAVALPIAGRWYPPEYQGLVMGMASFLTTCFHDQYGLSKVRAGDFTTIVVLAGSFLRPVVGWLSDKIGGYRLLLLLLAGVAGCLGGVGRLPALPLEVALLFLAMGMMGMGNGAVFQLLPQRFPERVGMLTGLVGAAGGLGGFFLPFILGAIKQRTGQYSGGLFLFASAFFAAALILLQLGTKWRASWQEES